MYVHVNVSIVISVTITILALCIFAVVSTPKSDDGNSFESHRSILCYGEEIVKTHIGCVQYQRKAG